MRNRISLAFAVVALAGAAPAFAQSLEVKSGSPLSIERLTVDATVDEGVASVEFDETFRNSTNARLEGTWKFRLPAEGVVSSFSMWMNGVEKEGRVLEAGQARRVYDSIVHRKKDPGLLEQTGWRDFQVSVFPIPANDTVRIRIRYAYVLPDDLGLETLELPLPVGCGSIGDLQVRARLRAERGLAALDCPSHADAKLVTDTASGEATWSGDGVTPTKAFVVRVVPKRDGFDVAVVASRPAEGGDGWFVARVVPRLAAPPSIPRDIVFVVDRSGSMEGRKIEQARAALVRGLGTLKAGDRFGVVSFATDVAASPALLPVTDENIAAATNAALALSASGGTNIAGALDAALALRSEAGRFFAVVFLTDGDPTIGEKNPERILAAWRAKSAGAARLFAFGVGADVKDFLLTKLAADGRGSATYVRDASDFEVKVSSLVDSIRTPILVDPEVTFTGDGVEVHDREPARLPDVFQGRALVITGRCRGQGKATLHLRGRAGTDAVDVTVPLDLTAAQDRPHVAQIWAKQRVERLLDDLRASGANAEIRQEIVRLGVRFQIVSPYTSFLVVEDGVRIPDAGDEVRVPDEPPGAPVQPPSNGKGSGGGSAAGAFGRKGSSGPPSDPPRPDDVPPETREPGDPPLPPDAGGPQTPGGEAPFTGGPDAGGPSSGGGDSGGGGGDAGGSSSGEQAEAAAGRRHHASRATRTGRGGGTSRGTTRSQGSPLRRA